MKKQMVVLVAVAGLTGLLAATSLTFAGSIRVAQVRKTEPVKTLTPLAAWQEDLDRALSKDAQYNADDAYEGDDNNEYEAQVLRTHLTSCWRSYHRYRP